MEISYRFPSLRERITSTCVSNVIASSTDWTPCPVMSRSYRTPNSSCGFRNSSYTTSSIAW